MKKRKGFTLIELLVVISIIALLLAILIPSLQRVRNNARAVVCQSNLKQWGTRQETERYDNNHLIFPDLAYLYFHGPNEPIPEITSDMKKILFCPMAVKISEKWFYGDLDRGMDGSPYPIIGSLPFAGNLGSAFKAWHSKGLEFAHVDGSYGFNAALFRDPYFSYLPFKSFYSKGQSKIPVMLDSASYWSIFIWEGQSPAPTEEEETSCCINRHNGGVNSLFLDWSVRKVGLKELWKLKWHNEFDTNGPWTKAGGVQPEQWPEWMRGFKDY